MNSIPKMRQGKRRLTIEPMRFSDLSQESMCGRHIIGYHGFSFKVWGCGKNAPEPYFHEIETIPRPVADGIKSGRV